MRALLLLLICGALLTAAAGAERRFDPSLFQEQEKYEQFLQNHPSSAGGHRDYANFLALHGNLRAATAHWRTAQQIEPQDAAVANSLGGAYLRMGRAAASATEFAHAVGLESSNAAYHFNLANVEYMLRHDLTAAWQIEMPRLLNLALAEFREASRLSPNDVEYARAYAETFYGVPDPDWSEAEAAWKHVLALSPESDFVYLHLARVSLKRGDGAGAREFLNKVVGASHDG